MQTVAFGEPTGGQVQFNGDRAQQMHRLHPGVVCLAQATGLPMIEAEEVDSRILEFLASAAASESHG